MSEKKKTPTRKSLFVYLTIVTIIGLVVFNLKSSKCEQFKNIKNQIITGFISKKYVSYESRPVGHLVIQTVDTIYNINSLQGVSGYDEVNIGDSVYKRENSIDFEFFRNKELIANIYFGNCD